MKVFLAINDGTAIMYRVTYKRRKKIKGKYYTAKYITYRKNVIKTGWWSK